MMRQIISANILFTTFQLTRGLTTNQPQKHAYRNICPHKLSPPFKTREELNRNRTDPRRNRGKEFHVCHLLSICDRYSVFKVPCFVAFVVKYTRIFSEVIISFPVNQKFSLREKIFQGRNKIPNVLTVGDFPFV